MKKLFGEWKMTWLKVILFAVIVGIYTGVIMIVPCLKETSFQDIGISFEWWLIFGVVIVVNCNNSREAMLKCFIFFLISQPIIYLVEVAAGCLAFERGLDYYTKIWLPATFLTLPGGFIAYFCKKQNVSGAVILGLGNTIQTVLAVSYFGKAFRQFPHHLLSGIVCIVSVIIMTVCIQKERKNRMIAFILPVILTAAILLVLPLTGRVLF